MKKILWNSGWTFYSDIDAEKKQITLPHDAMQTEKRIPGLKDGNQTAFYPGGVYTYEKSFELTSAEADSKTLLEFEGIYMNSTVYCNGDEVGGRIYGYSDFFVDLTEKLREGKNTIKVVADNSQTANSRWYSGSGIYRDVWMHTGDQEYICADGIKITTESIAPAVIHVMTDAVKADETEILVSVSKEGTVLAQGSGTDCTIVVPDADLWSAENPALYDVEVTLAADGITLDRDCVKTGIRKICWDSTKGFQVNGKSVKLRGGCIHHDNGFLGAIEFDTACKRRIRIMKEAGFNAVRIAHNPASKAMLRACDELGMYMMNESFDTWYGLKSPYDYAMYFDQECEKDLSDMVRLSYNHPSVVMYSIGNEVYFKDLEKATKATEKLAGICHKLDSSRAVVNSINPIMLTMADSENPESHRTDKVNPRAEGDASALSGSSLANVMLSMMQSLSKILANEKKMKEMNSFLSPLDIVGYNYGAYLYKPQHEDYAERVLVGSETFPSALYENWQQVKSMPWVVGDFLWTAWDYLGECGIGSVHYGKNGTYIQPFPVIAAGCANIDLTGEILPQGYYTSIVYGTYTKPYIAVHPANHAGEKVHVGLWRLTDAIRSWDFKGCEGKKTKVDVYSGSEKVELFQNGKSLGKKKVRKCMATFKVPYATGELKAIQYDASGKACGTDILRSAGDAKFLKVYAETKTLKAGSQDLIYLPIEITDENGIRRNLCDSTVTVDVEGPAVLAGLGSADLKQGSLTPYTGNKIVTYQGRALAILRFVEATGKVNVTVSAKGMDSVGIEFMSC